MLKVLCYVTLIPLLSVFLVYTAFLALCTARSIKERGVEIPLLVMLVAKFWLLVGLPADVVFNWTGWTFSSHIQWRVDNGYTDSETLLWVQFLNAGDPSGNHIKPKERLL